eukprot:1738131-Rhodomonas_salina.1
MRPIYSHYAPALQPLVGHALPESSSGARSPEHDGRQEARGPVRLVRRHVPAERRKLSVSTGHAAALCRPPPL